MPNTVENWRGNAVEHAMGVYALPEPEILKPAVDPTAAPSTRTLSRVVSHHHELRTGDSRKALVRAVADDRWPGMWRMVWPDGSSSDMANLARIKDAAADICQRTAPGKDRRRFHWKRLEI
jgi:hypothetical protein